MKVTVERMPESLVRLEIHADEAEFQQAIDKASKKVARDVQLPGFRRGKAPVAMIERMFGREVFLEEANRALMDDLYRRAIDQESIVPVGDPDVEMISPDPLAFAVIVPVYPTVDPGDYARVRIEPVDAAVDMSRVDDVIEQLRIQQSPWVDPAKPRKPKDGDQVTLDIALTLDGEPYQDPSEDTVFVIGESNLLDELRDAIVKLKVGETGSVDISFPEDDDRFAEDDVRRGKTLTYNLDLKGLKERDLLPLDDEFATTYGGAATMDELRQRLHDSMHAERTTEARAEAMNNVIDKIAEGASIEVPAAMVDTAIEERIARLRNQMQYRGSSLEAYMRQSGQDMDDLRDDLRETVAREVRNSLILRAIAEREGIEITDADIEAELETLTAGSPEGSRSRELYANDPYLRGMVRNDLFDRRLTDRLIEIVTDGKGAVVNGFVAPDATSDADDKSAKSAKAKKDAAPKGADAKKGSAKVSKEEIEAEAHHLEEAHTPQAAVAGSHEGSANPHSGACPDGFPIKGNASSHIYHVEGDASYGATIPEICFASEEAAQAAGYRPTVAHVAEGDHSS